LISALVYVLYRLIFLTVRVREVNRPLALVNAIKTGGPLVMAHWHGDEWFFLRLWGKRPITVLSSHSEQGTRMERVLRWLGFNVTRGSSSRGGAAGLRVLVEAGKRGQFVALAVDGPKGPRHVVKPGIIQLARLTQLNIVPLVGTSSRHLLLKKSWNQARLPLPFSRVTIAYGPPISVARDANENEAEAARLCLEDSLKKLSTSRQAT
jgi:lysophospholipid acyltransferase (LPLAT)-like uncharacterized protein